MIDWPIPAKNPIFAAVRSKDFKILVSIVLLSVFFIKMSISLAPLFSFLDSETAHAVIMQLEQETKSEKEGADKDAFKEKKAFDEQLMVFFEYRPFIIETNILHNLENSLYIQEYHAVVPTPPPNV